jgi:ABC-type phosphate/phosphonate transport system substrate-binding protein
MNVLRHKISEEIDPPPVGEPFFDQVLFSGSHVDSMKLVVSGKADVAAIDAVSFFHCQNENLLEVGKLKVIGQSTYTPGLPFIIPRVRDIDKSVIIDGLNKCLAEISTRSSEILKIQSFLSISHEEYQPIKQMELDAISNGYPELI